MPKTGERNEQFGMYISDCCGSEIVIAAGAVFPLCPKHCRFATWTNLEAAPGCIEEEQAA
jgi:hypothetical protein